MKRFRMNVLASLGAAAAAGLMVISGASALGPGHTHAAVGKKAPDFTLQSVEGKSHTLSEYTEQGKVVVLEWFNPDCPFVKKHYQAATTMNDLAKKFESKDVVWLAINSGHEGHPTTGMERNKRAIEEYDIKHPVLLDYTGEVGHMYGAKTTPHMYIIDADGVLRYAGAIDDNRGLSPDAEVNYVKQTLKQVLNGETVTTAETRAYGCSVKYGA